MPRMDGLETLERLRAATPSLPVLFLTARDASPIACRACELERTTT